MNSGGWTVYIIPLLLALTGVMKVKKFTRDIFSLSDNDINRIFPPHHMAT